MLTALALALLPVAAAKPITANMKPDDMFGDGLRSTYQVVFQVPTGFKPMISMGDLTLEKSFYEELSFELYSEVPTSIGIGDRSFTVTDTTARREVLLVDQDKNDYSFYLYRRLTPSGKEILKCDGSAESRAVYEAMLQICRTARLK